MVEVQLFGNKSLKKIIVQEQFSNVWNKDSKKSFKTIRQFGMKQRWLEWSDLMHHFKWGFSTQWCNDSRATTTSGRGGAALPHLYGGVANYTVTSSYIGRRQKSAKTVILRVWEWHFTSCAWITIYQSIWVAMGTSTPMMYRKVWRDAWGQGVWL